MMFDTVTGTLLVVMEALLVVMEVLLDIGILDCNSTCTLSNTVLTGKHFSSCGLYLYIQLTAFSMYNVYVLKMGQYCDVSIHCDV